MRISDWSSDVCSSDLDAAEALSLHRRQAGLGAEHGGGQVDGDQPLQVGGPHVLQTLGADADTRVVDEAVDRDRKSVVLGKSVSVSVDLGGRRSIKKKNT